MLVTTALSYFTVNLENTVEKQSRLHILLLDLSDQLDHADTIFVSMQELRKRPQSEGAFRIPRGSISPSQWESVALILRSGVGNSTLPCMKLKAIVDAAKEVSRLHAEEHEGKDLVGADDFANIALWSTLFLEWQGYLIEEDNMQQNDNVVVHC